MDIEKRKKLEKYFKNKLVKRVRCPSEFKSMACWDGSVAEHRLIMAKKIGRPLSKKEVVHHINGDRLNNKISNLILFENNWEHQKHHSKLKKIFTIFINNV